MSDSPFSPSAIKAHVDATLARIPEGCQGAMIGYVRLDGSVGVSLATRIGETWTAGATFERDAASGNVRGDLVVQRTW